MNNLFKSVSVIILLNATLFSCGRFSVKDIPPQNLLSGTYVLNEKVTNDSNNSLFQNRKGDFKFNYVQDINLSYNNTQIQERVSGKYNNLSNDPNGGDIGVSDGNEKREFKIGSINAATEIIYKVEYYKLLGSYENSIDYRFNYNIIHLLDGKKIPGTHLVNGTGWCGRGDCKVGLDSEEINLNLFGKAFIGKITYPGHKGLYLRNYNFKYGDTVITGVIESPIYHPYFDFDFKFGEKKLSGRCIVIDEKTPDTPNVGFNAESLSKEELVIFMLFFFNAIPNNFYRIWY